MTSIIERRTPGTSPRREPEADPSALHVLLLAAYCDGTDVGESFLAFRWVEELSRRCRVTVLSLQRDGRALLRDQLPGVEVVTWPEMRLPPRLERFNAMLKPSYGRFYRQARRWIRDELAAGRRIDLVHQISPMAMRFPSPAAGLGVPYVLGPMAGSLETPEGFRRECGTAAWYTRLRRLDRLRLGLDPVLRRSFRGASAVIGAAPYVKDFLGPLLPDRFEAISELAVDGLVEHPEWREPPPGRLRLLHVARAVRTKGLRDCVRALALLDDLPGVTLEVAGDGEELAPCRAEAEALGVSRRIAFHGRLPRARVEELYARADLFLFPSFREPTGGVLFEAMRHGVPIVTVDRGGPDHFVTEACGIKVPALTPMQLSVDLAAAIRRLAADPSALAPLRRGAHQRIREIGLWTPKMDRVMALYHDVLAAKASG